METLNDLAAAYVTKAQTYKQAQHIPEAAEMYLEAAQTYEQAKDTPAAAKMYLEAAQAYEQAQNILAAVEMYLIAGNLFPPLPNNGACVVVNAAGHARAVINVQAVGNAYAQAEPPAKLDQKLMHVVNKTL